MRSRFTFLLFCLILSNYLFAQDAVEDSLYTVLLKSAEDTNKVNIYYELIKRIRKYDYNRASKLAKDQLTLSQKLNYHWGIGKSFNALGLIEVSRKQSKPAIAYFMKGVATFDSIRDFGNLSSIYTNLSMVFSDLSVYMALSYKTRNDSSIYFAKIAEKYNDVSDVDSTKMLNNKLFIYGNLSIAYYNLNLHDSAMVYNNKSILLAEKLNRFDVVATDYESNGIIFLLQKNYDKAIEYFSKAINLYESEKLDGFAVRTKSNLSMAFYSKGDIKRSKEYLYESFKSAFKNGDSTVISQNYITSGLIELSENNFETALRQFEKGLKICEKTKNKNTERQLRMGCAEAYEKTHNYNKAITMYYKSLELSDGDYKGTLECYEALSKIFAINKNYEKAYKYLNEARILNSKLFDSTKSQIINELTIKYETSKKDQQIVILNKDKAIQKVEVEKERAVKRSLIAGTVMLFVFICIGFVLYKRKRDANLRKKEAELNAHITDVEMKALRLQMNPHFIFNSLRSIDEYIKHNQSSLASEYLIKFSKLMRAILENSRRKEITIAKDFEALELYMHLESQRLEYPFNYSIDIDPRIDPQNTLIPPMLLQPIVENSIWHGLAPKGSPGKIIIRIRKKNEMIQCEVEDDGIGRKSSKNGSKEKIINSESYGLKITEERLQIIGHLRKLETNLILHDLNQSINSTGLMVSFNLPYDQNT